MRVPATAEGRRRHGSLRTTAAVSSRSAGSWCGVGICPPATALTFTTDPPCRAGLLACTSAPDAAQICAGYAWDEVECMDDDRRPVPRSCKIPGATGRPRINLMQNPEKTGEIIVSCTEVRCQPWRRSALVQNCKTAKLANDT